MISGVYVILIERSRWPFKIGHSIDLHTRWTNHRRNMGPFKHLRCWLHPHPHALEQQALKIIRPYASASCGSSRPEQFVVPNLKYALSLLDRWAHEIGLQRENLRGQP
jgi:hypothetical protein